MIPGELKEPGSRRRQGLIPGDTLPAGIGVPFWPRPLERVEQPPGVIDEFRSCFAFYSQRRPGWMRGIRLQGYERAVLESRRRPAA